MKVLHSYTAREMNRQKYFLKDFTKKSQIINKCSPRCNGFFTAMTEEIMYFKIKKYF